MSATAKLGAMLLANLGFTPEEIAARQASVAAVATPDRVVRASKRLVDSAHPGLNRKTRREYDAIYQRLRLARFAAAGLTALGTPRIYQRHPELAGLRGNEYRKRYMALWRSAEVRA